MPRVETGAAERKAQRDAAQEQVAAELGRPVTVREAAAFRRENKGRVVISTLTADIEVDLGELDHVGTILASVRDFRIQPGGYATLQLVTDGRSFSHVLTAAALLSQSHNLVVDLCLTPKPQLEDDEDDAEEVFTGRVGG